ncbi:MAG: glycosyltransferase family A protein [bacterium]|nr:glycosyltransferase family A protein [bacterium]
MKLSIIIPAYNEEKYIGKCLESISRAAKNSGHEVEVIVINNASADRTREVALSYSQVKVFDEPKKGTNRSRQLGLTKATGDLIANIDADNRITKDWINMVFKEFKDNPKLVALSGPYIFYDISSIQSLMAKLYYYLAYPVYVINNRFFKKGGAIMGGNVVIKKSALEEIGGYNVALTFYGDDTDTAMRLSKVGIVKFNYKFLVQSSGRRLKKEGIISAGFRYVINHISVSLFKKSYNGVRKDFRHKYQETMAKIKD